MATGIVFPSSSGRELLVKNPGVVNIAVAVPNVEQSYAFAGNVRRLTIKCRGTAKMQIAFTSGESSINYITLPPGTVLTEENFELPITFYFQLDRADTVEILTWTKA